MTAELTIVRHRWRTVLSVTTPSEEGVRAAAILDEEIADFEEAASRFRPDSQSSAVTRGAGTWVPVSWYFVTVLTAALDAATITGGLVDPCLGNEVDAAGYRAWRDGDGGGDAVGAGAEPHPGTGRWREIEIRPASGAAEVRIPPGCQLDLGAVAKGWLADRLALRLAEELGAPALANMGGDLRAVGEWLVGADPEQPGVRPQSLEIRDAGLASSGRGRRAWQTPSGRAHHIIDPRTGTPARTRWVTAHVLAATAAGANAASTCAMILDDEAPEWLEARGLDAWLVGERSAITRVGRWPVAA